MVIADRPADALVPTPGYTLTQPYFSLRVWLDEEQQTEITSAAAPITVIHGVTRDMQLNQPYEYHIDLELPDNLTGALTKGNYVELRVGRTTPTLWASGYVMELDRTEDTTNSYQIVVSSPLLALSNLNNLGMFVTSRPLYQNVMDVLNGVDPSGKHPNPPLPGTMGMLSGTGWTAKWITGPGWPQEPVGTAGAGRGDWGSAMQNVQSMAQIYALYFRERWGSKASHGTLEFGPLSDPSHVSIWGGDPLTTKLGMPAGSRPSATLAQQMGLIAISSAQYQEHTQNVKNIVWASGQGLSKNIVTLRTIFGDVVKADGKTPADGVTTWQPNPHNGRIFFVKPQTLQTWRGHQYELIAEPQWDGNWAFGVVDRTSAAKYGPIEYEHRWPKATTAELLLALALGQLEMSSDPPPQWTFACRHPWNKDVPDQVFPGQTVDVNFAGVVHDAAQWNADGTWHDAGAFTYMSWPATTDPQALINVKRVVQVQDTLDATGYTATYTMGSTKKKPKHQTMLLSLARRMENVQHHHNAHPHRFVKHNIDHLPALFSKQPDAWAQDDQIWMNPGAIVVMDVPDANYFGDHQIVRFTVQIQEAADCVDFWFAKPMGATIDKVNISGAQVPNLPSGVKPQYALFRLCGVNFNGKCGFHVTTDGTALTHKGVEPSKTILTSQGRLPAGVYELAIEWSGGTYEAHLGQAAHDLTDNVVEHDLLAVWHDHDKAITTWGTLGWHYQGQSQPAIISNLSLHPHRRRTKAARGGNKGRYSIVTHGGSGGMELKHSADEGVFGVPTLHRVDVHGKAHALDTMHHGPAHPTSAVSSGVTVSAGLASVTFQSGMPLNTLKVGMTIYDSAGDYAIIKDLIKNGVGDKITGFSSLDPAAQNMNLGAQLFWDPLEANDLGRGHRRTGAYFPAHGGWGLVDIAADGDDTKGFVVYADGATGSLGGAKLITDANGDVVSIRDLAVTGEKFAKGLEHSGIALFDAGEVESTTQIVNGYPVVVNPLYTPSTTIGGDPTGLTDLTKGPTQALASWVSQTTDGHQGQADALLQLTAGPYSGHTYTTVQWQDTQILKEDGTTRTYKVTRDVSFTLPIWVAVGQSASALRLGALGYIKSITGNVIQFTRPISLPGPNAAQIQTSAGDTWVLGNGTSAQETSVVQSVDAVGNTVTFSPVNNVHAPGDVCFATKMLDTNPASPTFNQSVNVNSGMLLDGTLTSDTLVAAIDVVAIGFYAKNLRSGNNYWFRGYWGDPAWICPYITPTPPHLGSVPAVSGEWVDLVCKPSQLVRQSQEALYKAGKSDTYRILGVEIAVYSANPGTGQTVYFDAHQMGASASKTRIPGATIGGAEMAPGSVDVKHKFGPANADAHMHSDLTFWCASGTVYWESGSLITQTGTVYTINGGTEDAPNAGINGVLSGQAAAAGNWLVFNSTGSAIQLRDPIAGAVTIPAYSATGGTGGQTLGFGVLSEGYNFGARVGGGTVKNGTPKGLFKIGKIEKVADTYTGELPVKTHHSSGKKHTKHLRNGSVPPKKHHKKTPTRHHHKDVVFSIAQAGIGPNYTSTLTWTGGTLVDNSGNSLGTIPANSTGIAVSANQILYYDPSTNTYVAVAAGTNMDADAHANHYQVGHMSVAPDAGNYLSIYGWHGGLIQVGSNQIRNDAVLEQHVHASAIHGGESGHKDHHAAASHSRRHNMPHKAGQHHHHATSMECVGSVFYLNFSLGGATPSFNSTIQAHDGTNYILPPKSFSVSLGTYVVADTSGVASGGSIPVGNIAANLSPFPLSDTQILLCQIGASADADGNYVTEGHHHGPHKTHPHHIKTGAVHGGEAGKPNHIAGGAVQHGHIGAGQVQADTIANGVLHGGEGGFGIFNHYGSRSIFGNQHIALNGDILGKGTNGTTNTLSHLAASTVSGFYELVQDGGVRKGHLAYPNPGAGQVAATSVWDTTPLTTVNTAWTAAFFGNRGGGSGFGDLTSGSLTNFLATGHNLVFELQLRGADSVVGFKRGYDGFTVANGWIRFQINPRYNLGGQIIDPASQQYYYFDSTDGILTLMVRRFDVLNDGTVACEYYWACSNPSSGSLANCSVRFRATYGVLA